MIRFAQWTVVTQTRLVGRVVGEVVGKLANRRGNWSELPSKTVQVFLTKRQFR